MSAICGPIKTVHFLRYHIFAATTDIIMRFLLSVEKLQQKTSDSFFKRVLNILCKVIYIVAYSKLILLESVSTDIYNVPHFD